MFKYEHILKLDKQQMFKSKSSKKKFWHLHNFTNEKPCQPRTFIFSGADGINRKIIQLL